jgi:curli production assembly/transport component CsgG
MISTANGKILKSYISKTILSQAIDQSLLSMLISKIIRVETGYTTNEPVQMAVTEAIEKQCAH